MSGLEQAIRNALERAERSDPDIRARIYQSARNALDVGLRKQEIADMSVIERQRQRLEATIRDIEDEELARLRSIARFERVAIDREPEVEPEIEPERPFVATRPAMQEPPVVPEASIMPEPAALSTARPSSGDGPPRRSEPTFAAAPIAVEPLDAEFEDDTVDVVPPNRMEARHERRQNQPAMSVEPDLRDRPETRRSEPAVDAGLFTGLSATRDTGPSQGALPGSSPDAVPLDAAAAEALAPAPRRRGRLGAFVVSAFVYLFLFGLIGGGVWWVYDTGMIDAALKGSSDFQLVPEALQSEQTPSGTEQRLGTLRGFSGEWIDIFRPGTDTAAVKARARAVIEDSRDSDGLATVITSNAPDQDGDVLVEIPAAYLQEISGKTSTLAVTVKSNTDKPAQIYIQCEFKSLGDCGRHRYTVTNERADQLIQVKFEGKLAPSAAGHIVINSDLTGEGTSIRLYGIRVLPGS